MTTPNWVIICCVAPTTPRSSSATVLAMAATSAGADMPRPTPESARAPTTTRSDDPAVSVDSPNIETNTASAPPIAGEPLAGPHREVAHDRPGDREGQRSGDEQRPGLGLAVAEHALEQQRGDDEAAHVGEVGEDLGEDRDGEVAAPQVLERQQGRPAPSPRPERRPRPSAARRRSRPPPGAKSSPGPARGSRRTGTTSRPGPGDAAPLPSNRDGGNLLGLG